MLATSFEAWTRLDSAVPLLFLFQPPLNYGAAFRCRVQWVSELRPVIGIYFA
jgi:hypothetical protein